MMARHPVVIEGTIELDRPRSLAGAAAEVQLREDGMADAAAKIVARGSVAPPEGRVARVPFRLEAVVDEDASYALAAEIRLDGGAALAPGDLLTTVHHGWRREGADSVTLPVKVIS